MGRGLSEQERRILRPASISGRGIESWRGAMTRKRLTDHRVILARQQEQKKFEENAAAELKKWGNREFDKYATELDKVEQNALNREVPLPDASDNESNSVPESLWDDLGIGATGAQKRADWLQAHARENETTDWVDGRGEKPEYVHTPWKTDPVNHQEIKIFTKALGAGDGRWFLWYWRNHAQCGPRNKPATAAQRQRFRQLKLKLHEFLKAQCVTRKSAHEVSKVEAYESSDFALQASVALHLLGGERAPVQKTWF